MPTPRSLLSVPAVALAAAVLALSGCSGSGSGTSTPSATASASSPSSPAASAAPLSCATHGAASDAVKVSGAMGTAPKVSFPTPTTAAATERTVVHAGSGAEVKTGSSLQIAYTLYEAKTGKQLDSGGYGSKKPVVLTANASQYLPGLVQSMLCGKAGERFASVIPASLAFGTAGSPKLGVGPGDSLVLVADILKLTPTRATGTTKALPSGFPTVTLAADGQPTVTIPKTTAPTTLKIADSKVGTGETVRSGDTVTVQYQGTLWRTGTVFDQSWGKTGPTSFATTAVVKGFGAALVGQKVGSQVVAIVPPSQGYGAKGSSDGSIKGTDTMVFVIDVLATTHA